MKCPGQDSKYWKDDAIFEVACPKCGKDVEFYKDDTSRKCSHCRHRFVNPKLDFGCASYCQFAEQCLGTLPEDFTGPRDDLLKDKIAVEVKRFHHTDFKAIRKATSAARHAEVIGKNAGANLVLILCTTLLRGIGNDAVSEILKKVGAGDEMIVEIQELLREQDRSVSAASGIESRIIHDALLISDTADLLRSENSDNRTADNALESNLLTGEAQEYIKTLFAPA